MSAPESQAALVSVGSPRLELQALVLNSLSSPHSRRVYARALQEFLRWLEAERPGPFNKAVVQQYRARLEASGRAPATINLHLAAVKKLASEAADNGLLAPELAAGIARVRGARRLGARAGNWLTRQQAQQLINAPDWSTLKGKRDRAILALLIGCGLRRSELINLTFDRIQQRESRWVIVDLEGKGNRVRSVPVPAWVKALVDEWTAAANLSTGRLFRSINKSGRIWGAGITPKVVWWIVLEYAELIGVPNLAPHDLRRTCAKLCRASGAELEQIQLLLGHASIQTTERYLGSRQNLAQAVNDQLGIQVEQPSR